MENQLALLQGLRKKKENEKKAIEMLRECLLKIENAESREQLLGYEGNASKIFFQTYFAEFDWKVRLPRTKYDITNVLLDIGYTHLFYFVDALLRIYGFDTYVGFYHQEFYQRKSLTCDVMEPLRCIIDTTLRTAFHLKQINPKDFTVSGHQYLLKYKESAKYSALFSKAIMERKEEIFRFIQSLYMATMKENSDNIQFFSL